MTYLYDGFGRQETVEDALGNLSTTVYDSFSRVQASINPRGEFTTYHYV